jgi:hypothetical protein
MSARRSAKGESGYSLIELLISTAIMVTVTGAIFALVNPAHGTSQAQPEVADLQQRMRVGSDVLFKELLMAGAGMYHGPVTGSLVNFFAPVIPRRMGRVNPDARDVFRPDAVTLIYIPNTISQTTISAAMPNVSAELKVQEQSHCPAGLNLCGFREGMEVLIFDTSGHFDLFSITEVQDAAAHLQHRGQDLSYPYDPGASVTAAESNTYYLDRTSNQLKKYNGASTDVPVVDNVVDLQISYFGDPAPPVLPKPALGTANCLYSGGGTYVGPAALPATDGSLAALDATVLTDGPWCGFGSNQFDADLLRIRKVRVMLRLQVASAALRGSNALLWRKPGKSSGAERMVPDYVVTFDVSPRNLNLTR